MNFGFRQLFRQCQGYTARAGADIDNAEVGERGLPPRTTQHRFYYMLGFRTRNQHRPGDDKIHAPELLVAGDVLRGNALRTLGEGIVVTSFLLSRELMLWMSVQKRSIATQGKHEQQLGIHSRRRDLSRRQALDCRTEHVAKMHPTISPQAGAHKCFGGQRRFTVAAARALPVVHFDFAAAVAAVIRATTAREFLLPARFAAPAIDHPGQAGPLLEAAPAY